MPVPSLITELSTTAGDNSPAGSEAVLPNLDNYLRAFASFIRQVYDALATKAPLASAVPAGAIVMWSGSVASIPSGWALCNGANGTPDLRNRFVIGAGSTHNPGATGGATSVNSGSSGSHSHGGTTGSTTLTVDQIPSHTHDNVLQQGATPYWIDLNRIAGTSDKWATGNNTGSTTGATGGGQGHTHTIGSDGSHTHSVATMPPYYALAYIMKL